MRSKDAHKQLARTSLRVKLREFSSLSVLSQVRLIKVIRLVLSDFSDSIIIRTAFLLQQSYGRQASFVPVADYFGDPHRSGCSQRKPKEA